jgi:prephenate dehydratase
MQLGGVGAPQEPEYVPEGNRLYVIYSVLAQNGDDVHVATSWHRAKLYAQHIIDDEIMDDPDNERVFVILQQPGPIGVPLDLIEADGDTHTLVMTVLSV